MGSTPGIAGQVGPALLEDGEAVVSRRGMATAGAADIIRALERNEIPDLGPAPIVFGDDQADILSLRQNRPYAPAARGRAMVGTRSMYGRR